MQMPPGAAGVIRGQSPRRSAGSGTRTHTHGAQDPKSCLSTNFNIPARAHKDRKFYAVKKSAANIGIRGGQS